MSKFLNKQLNCKDPKIDENSLMHRAVLNHRTCKSIKFKQNNRIYNSQLVLNYMKEDVFGRVYPSEIRNLVNVKLKIAKFNKLNFERHCILLQIPFKKV